MTQREHDLALLAAGHETGFYDENGHPTPWPNDFDEWTPVTEPIIPEPGQPPF